MTLKKGNLHLVIGILIGMVLGILIGTTHLFWNDVSKKFFEIKITDIGSIAMAAILTVFVTHFIRNSTDKESKRREMIGGVISTINKNVCDVCGHAVEYYEKDDVSLEPQIKRELKLLGMNLPVVLGMVEAETDNESARPRLKQKLTLLRKAITDSPFGQSARGDTKHRVDMINSSLVEMQAELYSLHYDLFS